jgi:hypothetical protein
VIFKFSMPFKGGRGVVGWITMLRVGRPRVPFPMKSLDFFDWARPTSRNKVLGFTQTLTEMNTRNLSSRIKRGWHVRLTTTSPWVDCLGNVGFLFSHKPDGVHGLLERWFYFALCYMKETVND